MRVWFLPGTPRVTWRPEDHLILLLSEPKGNTTLLHLGLTKDGKILILLPNVITGH